jgi:hypothetical protein
MSNPWNHTNNPCSYLKRAPNPIGNSSELKRNLGIWKGKPGKSQPGIESVNNPYQG